MKNKRKPPIENKIYASIIGYCESIERKSYNGNGHHLAQRLTSMVSAGLLSKQQKKIYDAMPSEKDITTGDIAKSVNLPSKLVSVQLKQMKDSTLLIHSKKNGRFNVWRKHAIG